MQFVVSDIKITFKDVKWLKVFTVITLNLKKWTLVLVTGSAKPFFKLETSLSIVHVSCVTGD